MSSGRWEWRTFGESFGAADERFASLTPEQVQESDELYLLSVEGDASVKVRDDLMDVKHLQRVNRDGLEQWLPVLKASFPLGADDLLRVLAEVGATADDIAHSSYTLEQLLEDFVTPSPDLLALEVHKRRERHTLNGCMSELTDIHTPDTSTSTIAVESEDASRVIATVRELGLDSRRNVCMARGLKELTGFGTHRYAVVDVGTNSVKFHIGERGEDGSWTTIVDRAEVERLGEGLAEARRLKSEAIERTVAAIAAMVDEAKRRHAGAVAAVGTAGLRIAKNRADLLAAVRERTGLEIEVIPGEEEARLAYVAAKAGLRLEEGSLVLFDTGGGSSQFTFGHGDTVDEQFSVEVGAVRFTERYRLDNVISKEDLSSALAAIGADLARLDGRPRPDALVGLGGAVTNLAAVKHELVTYDADVVQGTELDRAEIERQIELYRTRSADERRDIVGLQPKRAEIILAGACIVHSVMTKLDRASLTVCDRGLRHGLLLERFGAPRAISRHVLQGAAGSPRG